METVNPQSPLQQDCLDKLGRVLDLVLKTAEAASAENNHKIVIQSAREVTRIVALIHKITAGGAKSSRSPRAGLIGAKTDEPCAPTKKTSSRPEPTTGNHAAAGHQGQTDLDPEDLVKTYQEMLLTPSDPAYWDDAPGAFFQKFTTNRELQALEKEAAAFLRGSSRKSGAAKPRGSSKK